MRFNEIVTELYDDNAAVNSALSSRHNGIFYLGYLTIKVFGNHLLSLACFYLITKSIICILNDNVLNRFC